MAEKKKPAPKMPEPYTIYDEEDDNLFFAASVEFEGYEAAMELSLVVDVKNTGEDDSMEYLYTVFQDTEDIDDLIKWLKKAKKYIQHVEQHGSPITLILGVEDSERNVESE